MPKRKKVRVTRSRVKQKGAANNKITVAAFAVLFVLSLPLVVGSVLRQTNTRNFASGIEPTFPEEAINNLNDTAGMFDSNNPDGTMGPINADGNWSNALPESLKGTLVFAVTDPVQSQRPTDSYHVQPTHMNKTQGVQGTGEPTEMPKETPGQGQMGQQGDNGVQTVTSLKLTITKGEVHYAYLGEPGNGNDQPTMNPQNKGKHGKPSVSPNPFQNGPVNHWLTLDLANPTVVDLIDLAKTNMVQTLGVTSVGVGKYTELRLYISDASATFADGKTVQLTLLGHDNTVRIVHPYSILANQSTKMTLFFDAQHSVVGANGQYYLKPVVAKILEEKI